MLPIQQGHGYGPLLANDQLNRVVTYATLGAAYAIAGWVRARTRSDGPEPFRPKKAAQTVLIGAVAGAILAVQGQEFNEANLEAATAVAIPVANELVNAGKNKRRRASDGSA